MADPTYRHCSETTSAMWWPKWGLPETFAEDGELDAEAAGSHPQSAERVEDVQDGGKTGTGVRGRDMGIEDGI